MDERDYDLSEKKIKPLTHDHQGTLLLKAKVHLTNVIDDDAKAIFKALVVGKRFRFPHYFS